PPEPTPPPPASPALAASIPRFPHSALPPSRRPTASERSSRMEIRHWPLIGVTLFIVAAPRLAGQSAGENALPHEQEDEEIVRAARPVRLSIREREAELLKAIRAAGGPPSPEQEQQLVVAIRKSYQLTLR